MVDPTANGSANNSGRNGRKNRAVSGGYIKKKLNKNKKKNVAAEENKDMIDKIKKQETAIKNLAMTINLNFALIWNL
uniref:Uncharacterized protein n=1 Tax=Panagrolaimus sp. ES5 TaxID=591445 RepID=A0AC34FWX4_9BILA